MTVKESAAFLRQHDNYLILTHKRPDGDTIGCAAALCEGLRALGRTAWICPHAEETHLFTPYLEGRLAPEGYVPDTVVSVDIAARSLFTRAGEPWLARGLIWPSTTTLPRRFLRRRPAWTPVGPPAAS